LVNVSKLRDNTNVILPKSFAAPPKPSPEGRPSNQSKVSPTGGNLEGAGFIEVFTTRVDTIFGVSFVVIAPEHELVASLTTPDQKLSVDTYIAQTKKKSELDRMADTKTISGAFTGSYVINPLNGAKVPVWIADYVLAGYGTGCVMGVPSGDQRDYLFAKHFDLPIIPIIDTNGQMISRLTTQIMPQEQPSDWVQDPS